MYIKLIRVTTTPDRKTGFLERQRLWNVAMASCPGFIDSLVASDTANETDVVIITIWRDKQSLEQFMAGGHDEIQTQSGIRDYYDQIKIDFLTVEQSLHPSAAGHLLFGEGTAGLIELSEAYRGSAILSVALRGGLFEQVGVAGTTLATLSAALNIPPFYLKKLCYALASLGLMRIDQDGDTVSLTAVAEAHLLQGKTGYIGHLLLHNTRPLLWSRWGRLATELNMTDVTAGVDEHGQFLAAMSDLANAGQVEQLLSQLDLQGHRHLLDIGGALGDYSIAILRAYPEIRADLLDLPQSRDFVEPRIEAAGLGERLHFIEGDYRKALPEGNYDLVLLANVLRGELRGDAEQLLARIFSVMRPGGMLLLYDLFSDTVAGHSGVLAGFFGLHLPDALNPTTAETSEILRKIGFTDVTVSSADKPLVANQLITAYVPNET